MKHFPFLLLAMVALHGLVGCGHTFYGMQLDTQRMQHKLESWGAQPRENYGTPYSGGNTYGGQAPAGYGAQPQTGANSYYY